MPRSKKEVEAIVSAMGVFMGFISNLVELVKKLGGSMENIYHLATPEGSSKLEAIARIIVEKTEKAREVILKLISGGESLILDAVDGAETLAEAEDVFAYIDSDFKKYRADEKGPATDETPVEVYEMAKDATFAQMFGSLNYDVGRLCLTQHQIKNFVRKYRGWLRKDGYPTFFLFKSNNQFFVACVFFGSGGVLEVDVGRFGSDDVWYAGSRRRVVVPQLA
ncbi:MAG: hypothetical protein WC906_02105 [Parcubacteria group bacterium]